MMPGSARSASVIDRPHVGQATQAIDQRRTLEMLFRKLHAVATQHVFQPAAILRSNVREQNALVRREPNARLESRANLAQGFLQSPIAPISDAAVLDVQSIEPAAVSLLVPAHVIVEAMHVVGMRIGQLLAVVLLDFGLELCEAPVVDQILQAGDLAIRSVAEIALHLDDFRGNIDNLLGRDEAIRLATAGKVFFALGVTPIPPPTSTL